MITAIADFIYYAWRPVRSDAGSIGSTDDSLKWLRPFPDPYHGSTLSSQDDRVQTVADATLSYSSCAELSGRSDLSSSDVRVSAGSSSSGTLSSRAEQVVQSTFEDWVHEEDPSYFVGNDFDQLLAKARAPKPRSSAERLVAQLKLEEEVANWSDACLYHSCREAIVQLQRDCGELYDRTENIMADLSMSNGPVAAPAPPQDQSPSVEMHDPATEGFLSKTESNVPWSRAWKEKGLLHRDREGQNGVKALYSAVSQLYWLSEEVLEFVGRNSLVGNTGAHDLTGDHREALQELLLELIPVEDDIRVARHVVDSLSSRNKYLLPEDKAILRTAASHLETAIQKTRDNLLIHKSLDVALVGRSTSLIPSRHESLATALPSLVQLHGAQGEQVAHAEGCNDTPCEQKQSLQGEAVERNLNLRDLTESPDHRR